ncbi:MAG: zinc ribbon domain-containing protein [Candidatus Micrarchaeota archaeon]|nr:zinc ribbon domain-containing protein [Candidatus Micrarchaeota archaeon]
MDIFDSVVGKVKSDLTYRAGSEISGGIEKAVKGGVGKAKGDQQPKKVDKCPKCNKPLPEPDLKFCPECGTKLVATCEKCTKDFPYGTKFCTQCGSPLK